jgi:hypothetical protein
VLDSRTHKRVYLGDEITVKGSLSKALKLPEIIRALQSPHLSARPVHKMPWQNYGQPCRPLHRNTRWKNLTGTNPKSLSWDDPRSNRRPPLGTIKTTNQG